MTRELLNAGIRVRSEAALTLAANAGTNFLQAPPQLTIAARGSLPRPILPSQDALDLIDEYHAGTRCFISTEVGPIELGCSQAVVQAFIAEAFEEMRR